MRRVARREQPDESVAVPHREAPRHGPGHVWVDVAQAERSQQLAWKEGGEAMSRICVFKRLLRARPLERRS